MKQHHFQITTTWSGNLGTGTSGYRNYSRNHEVIGPAKTSSIPGSSQPVFRGDPSRYNPEELLLAAVANCHMLWVLHLCADAGITITEYSDAAEAEMQEHPDGSGEIVSAVLHPAMSITDPARIADALAIHDKAHSVCCLARSVKFPVSHQPVISGSR
jgi:organic hydroperoxide reductase OsmC/OhrA